MEMVWKMAILGASTILEKCDADRQYGNFHGSVQLGDEGMTDIHVSNFATVEGVGQQDDLMRRSRKRLKVRQTPDGTLSADYDDKAATSDMFRTQMFVV